MKRNVVLGRSLSILIAVCAICILFMPFIISAREIPDLQKGINLFEGKQYAEAKNIFENLRKTHPENALIAYNLGKCFVATYENKKAVKVLEKAVKLDGEQADYYFALGFAYSRYLNDVGMFRKIGLANKFKKAMMTAVDLDEKHIIARVFLISFYLSAPGLFGGSVDEAETHMDILKRHYPHMIFTAEGRIAAKKENYEEAEMLYRQAVKYNRSAPNLFNFANFLSRRNKLDEAIALLNEYLTMDLSWRDWSKAMVYFYLGTFYEDKKMYDASERALQSAKACNQEKWLNKEIDKMIKEIRKKRSK